MSNIDGQGFANYNPTYVAQACKLPTPQIYITEKWIMKLDLDVLDCVSKMMVPRRQFRMKPSGDYETSNLHTPYRLLDLMLNHIFVQANGNFYKISWVPVTYFVARKRTIFNWDDIVANSLSSSISVALLCLTKRKSKFYMSSFLIDCIFSTDQFPTLN